MVGLGGNDFAGAGLQDLALAPGALDGGTGRLGEGMGLDGDVLGGEFVASDDDLVGVELGLGDGVGLEEGVEIAGRSGGDTVKRIQLDEVVFFLGVSGSHGSPGELGQPAVEGGLSSLESRSGGSSGSGLLSAHTETAGGSLSGGDTASLAGSRLAGTGGGAEGVEGEFEVFDVVDVGFVGLAALYSHSPRKLERKHGISKLILSTISSILSQLNWTISGADRDSMTGVPKVTQLDSSQSQKQPVVQVPLLFFLILTTETSSNLST